MNIGKVVSRHYLIGIIRHIKAGDIEVVTVFGLNVYERIGCYKWMLGFHWGRPNE